MNLYKLHDSPKSLKHHDTAQEHIPEIVWERHKSNRDELRKREHVIARSPHYAFMYARDVTGRPFPKGEQSIARNTYLAGEYVKHVLKKPWPEGEAAMRKYDYVWNEYQKFLRSKNTTR